MSRNNLNRINMKNAKVFAGVLLVASVFLASCKPDFCDCVDIKKSREPDEDKLEECNEAYKDMPREEQMERFKKCK